MHDCVVNRRRAYKCIIFHLLGISRCIETTVDITANFFYIKPNSVTNIVCDGRARTPRAMLRNTLPYAVASLLSRHSVFSWMAHGIHLHVHYTASMWYAPVQLQSHMREAQDAIDWAQLSLNKVLLRLILIKWIYVHNVKSMRCTCGGLRCRLLPPLRRKHGALCHVVHISHGITFVSGDVYSVLCTRCAARVRLRMFITKFCCMHLLMCVCVVRHNEWCNVNYTMFGRTGLTTIKNHVWRNNALDLKRCL